MSSITISPSCLSGTVSVPPSKSAAHRAIICAALAKGVSHIAPVELSDDIRATVSCMEQLGASLRWDGNSLTVDGTGIFSPKSALLDCGESGSTLRFLIPVAAAGGTDASFVGHGRLPERPIGVLTDCLPSHGTDCITKGGLPLQIHGQLRGGLFEIPGNVSSQFITGLLLALPLLPEDSEIRLTSPLQSAGYIQMTLNTMKDFGVFVTPAANGWLIQGGQAYQSRSCTVEGDWSQAAFYLTAGALGGRITIDNLSLSSAQGDKACLELYRQFGAEITLEDNGAITVAPGKLRGITLNAEQIPDLVPALAVTAALCEGRTVITGAARLRIKECDRLAAMQDGLSRLGARITETPDGLIIDGVSRLKGGFAEGYHDHRIVMSMAVAAAACDGDITISDKESINKSYPTFFEEYSRLGGICHVNLG